MDKIKHITAHHGARVSIRREGSVLDVIVLTPLPENKMSALYRELISQPNMPVIRLFQQTEYKEQFRIEDMLEELK